MDFTLKIIESIIQSIIGGGLVWVAIEANKINRLSIRRLSAEERLKIEDIFDKIYSAQASILIHNDVNEEAERNISSATVYSKLYLPYEDHEKIKEFSNKITSVGTLYRQLRGNYSEEVELSKADQKKYEKEKEKIIEEVLKFDSDKLFSKFLGIKTK